MTLSSLRICLGIFLLVEVQSPLQVGASNIERDEPAKSPLTILRRVAQDPPPGAISTPPQESPLVLKVRDENGAPVTSAKVYLYAEGPRLVATWETDFQGRVTMTGIAPGIYQMRVEKQGFFSAKLERLEVGKAESFDLTLEHEQEIRESVDVTSAPPTIDQTRTVASDEIGAREITNLPYPRKREFKTMAVYLPRVHQDSKGQLHLNGAQSYQTFYALDGFNISNPASGLLELRVSPDALRKIEIQSSRFSAEYGKASGGVLNLTTGMGDDRFRIAATDFAPSAQFVNGITLDSWTPRLAIGGPFRKQRAWFYTATEGEVDLDIRTDLPDGANRNRPWRVGQLAKGQVNLSPTHLVNVGALVNQFHSENANLSEATPLGTAPELKQDVYLLTAKDQVFRANGLMVETGFAARRVRSAGFAPRESPYQLVSW